jgi:peptidoglycan-N-acetylglucosamine deacetylase
MPKAIASLSLDLDNQWSYMKTHGDAGWESFPSYLGVVVPRVLKFLAARNLKITFFIVGQDAAIPSNTEQLRSIADAGHEIGNHSFHHEPWLHLYSREQLEAEITRAEQHIQQVTGQRPIGFRGPGFSTSDNLISVLAARRYLYDASTLPTFIGPLARTYYFLSSKFDAEEREKRKALFGKWSDVTLPIAPYVVESQHGHVVEIPVTTMPMFRIPIHISYILYISTFSRALARFYFRFALALCRLTNTQPSLLLHPLDFLGRNDISELQFFPGMGLPHEAKLEIVSEMLEMFSAHYTVVPLRQHAAALNPGLARELSGGIATAA